MTPLEILHDVIKIARILIDQAQMVESNKKEWASLMHVINQVVQALQGLNELPRQQNFVASLEELRNILHEANDFLADMIKMPYYKRFVFAGKHKDKIKEHRQSIVEQLPLLHLGLSAELLVDREQDRLAELQDKQDFLQQQESILAKRQTSLSHQRHDFEHMMQKQMVDFQAQLEKNWMTPDPIETTLPDALALPLYEVTFEEKIQMSRTGDLYRGKWQDHPVLVKWIEGDLSQADRQQFIREARLMSTLEHPNLIAFYGACIEPSRMCIVTSRIEHRLIDQLSQLSLQQRTVMAHELLLGLEYLHHQGIYHSHIHPNTIGISASGKAQWMDLSWIKTDLLSLASLGVSPQVTVWQAPEAWQDRDSVSEASDAYSVGWLLWVLYKGRLPFHDRDPGELKRIVRSHEREVIPISCPYGELIERCWSIDPTIRPSLEELRLALIRPDSPSGEMDYECARKSEEVGDMDTALPQYTRSAEKGYFKSLTRLGVFALKTSTTDVAQIRTATQYFKAASDQGHALADYNLGRMHEKGITETGHSDMTTALSYYRQAQDREPNEPRYHSKVDTLTYSLRK